MIIYILIFLFGLIVGSFLNCVIFRLEKNKSFLKGRSYCPNCKHVLAWYDLIPVLSFIVLKRRCHYCKKPISWQYPLVEMITGLLFLLIINPEISIISNVYYLFIISFLIVIFIYDLKHFIIPDKVLYPAIAISFLYVIVNNQFSLIDYFSSAIGASLFFLLIYLISKGKWIGFGDVKLAILLGLLLGWPRIVLALFLSFVIGGIIGLGLIILSKKKFKSEVPFAPFLICGTLISLLWGGQIISWYLSLIF
ncbi:MAG: prepilin peptidase [Patescibacteria group bacterium]|nr:prepilin peptidase [Patescibacteria group bacterium]